MDFPESTRTESLSLYQQLYPEANIELSPSQAELKSRFNELKTLIERITHSNFIQTYLDLLNQNKISCLNPELLFKSPLQDEYDQRIDELNLKFMERYPHLFQNLTEPWEVPYFLEYRSENTEYWNQHQTISKQFLNTHMPNLSLEELLWGLDQCHNGSECEFSMEDIQLLTSQFNF